MSCDNGTCGTGGWGGPKPGDPSNNATLSATSGFGGINLDWTLPTVNPQAVAFTRVFRAIIPQFDATILIRDSVGGNFYFDKVAPGTEYFYWIQFLSVNGTPGEVIGPASAIARDSIAETIEMLTGKIDAGVLAQALKTQIARIPEIDDKIFKEIEDRLAANTALSQALAVVTNVSNETKSYVLSEVQQRQTADDAFVSSINQLFAQAAGNAAAISEEKTIRVSKDEALGQRIDTIGVALGPQINAAIVEERVARVNADSAMAKDITTLQTTFNTGLANATAAINEERTARTTADGATAGQINDLYAKYDTVSGATTGAIQAAITSEQQVRAAADGALATDINTLFSRAGAADAAIQNTNTALANQNTAQTNQLASARSAITTEIGDALAGEVTKRNAAISSAVADEARTRAATDSNVFDTLAARITGTESTFGSNLAQAQTTLQTNINGANGRITSIGALYTAKVTVNGLIGGFGVYNDGTEVQAGFDVDTFWIGRTAANKRKPFIVVGSEVFIDQAIINTLTFDKLRAADGSVVVQGGRLQAAYIAVEQLVAQNISVVSGTYGQSPYTVQTNGLTSIYYANGALAVRLGVW